MQNAQNNLRHDVLGSDQVDVVHPPNVLQLDVPFAQLFRRQRKAVLLVSDIVVLAEDCKPMSAPQKPLTQAVRF